MIEPVTYLYYRCYKIYSKGGKGEVCVGGFDGSTCGGRLERELWVEVAGFGH